MAKDKGTPMRVNPKRLTAKTGMCFEELGAYLACIAAPGSDLDERCAPARRAMIICASSATKQGKSMSTINHHLQRISRLMR